jgi:hypothetical protein
MVFPNQEILRLEDLPRAERSKTTAHHSEAFGEPAASEFVNRAAEGRIGRRVMVRHAHARHESPDLKCTLATAAMRITFPRCAEI